MSGVLSRPFQRHAQPHSARRQLHLSANTKRVVAAMATKPSVARKKLMDTLVRGLMTDGIWDRLDVFYLFSAHAADSALINWKNPGTYDATVVNLTGSDFTVDRGYQCAVTGTKYIRSNWSPANAGNKYLQNDASMGQWLVQHAAATTPDANQFPGMFTTSPAWGSFLKPYNSNTANQQAALRLNSGSTVNVASAVLTMLGLMAGDRADSSNMTAWRNGAALATSASTSVAPQDKEMFIGAANGASGAQSYMNGTPGMAWAGGSLGATLQAAMYNRVLTYLQALGAA